jgi:predicted HicB family RNase H-like nuclease
MKTVSYKGFQASVEYEDEALFVRVLHIDDVLVTQVASVPEVQPALEALVDDYIATCADLGREPAKAFSGSFNVRVDKEMHRSAAMAAAASGCSLNTWVEDAIHQKVECDRFSDRISHVLQDVKAEVRLLQVAGKRHPNWAETEGSHIRSSAVVSIESFRLVGSARDTEIDDGRAAPWRH